MKKKKVVKKEYDYRRTFLVFTIVFSIIIGISTYWSMPININILI